MGFYAPAQILSDAQAHDVTIYPICINNSYWDNTLETDENGKLALRLGFRQIIGLTKEDASWITAARGNGYSTIEDIWRRAGIKSATLNRLAEADAFISIGINQREAIWQASAILSNNKLPLFNQDIDGEIIKKRSHITQYEPRRGYCARLHCYKILTQGSSSISITRYFNAAISKY